MSVKNKAETQQEDKKQSFLTNFISRPVLAIVINLTIAIVGIVCWNKLSVRELPQINFPVITVKTEYPSAGPNVVESQITIPLEEAFAGLEGLDYMQSSSTNGQSSISLHFKNDRNIDAAAADVRDRMAKAKDSFPHGLRDPIISKAALNAKELIRLVAYSDTYNLSEVADQLERNAKGQIEAIPGVATVQIFGGGGGGDSGAFRIHAIISPEKLHAYDLTVKEVREAIQYASFKKPLGDIVKKDIAFTMTLNQSAVSLEDYANMIIKQHKSGIVRLKDVADVKLITDDPNAKVRYKSKPCVIMGIIPQQGSNPLETATMVKHKLKGIQKTIPRNLKLEIESDNSEIIQKSIHSVYVSIFEAILFVLLVMLLFLRSWKTAFIPMITIPICLLGGFFIIYLFNFTINTLTLLAMVFAIGLVVDDAIVVLENIYRHIEEGMAPLRASILGIQEIQFAVIAMTITLMAVYAPITLSSGLIGKLFIEFAVTLAGTVLISGIVALVLTPMLCANILTKTDHNSQKPWQIKTQQYLDKIETGYAKYLKLAIENSKNVIIGCVILSATGLLTAKYYLPKCLMPEVDTGYIVLSLESPSGATAKYVDHYTKKIENVIKNSPDLSSYLVSIQSRGGRNAVYIKLVDQSKRKKTCKQILKDIDKHIENVQSGLHVRSYCSSGSLGGGTESEKTVSFVIQSQKGYDEMEEVARQIFTALATHKNIDPRTMQQSRVSPEKALEVKIRQDKAAQLNVRMLDLGEMLSFVMRGQPPADRFEQEGKRYPMMILVDEEFRNDPNNIKRFHIRSIKSANNERQPQLVSLHELLEITDVIERPLAVRYEGMRSYEILFEVKNKSPIKIFEDVSKMLDKILPNGYKYSPTGELRKTVNEGSNITMVFILAIIFIFLIMAAQFESFIDPFIIMLSVPMALAGGILILVLLPDASLNIYTYIALITLIGLIAKHGILIVDFANKILAKSEPTAENVQKAIKESCALRLRPILMTTAAMILGAVPLALARGSGYEIRSQIGWVIVAGMAIGTLFTVFFVPCVYIIIKSRLLKRIR